MTFRLTFRLTFLLACLALALPARAQEDGPLRLEITEGVVEPLPFALPPFLAGTPGAGDYAGRIGDVIAADLTGSGLFRRIPEDAYIARVTAFDSPVQYGDWKTIGAQALITGAVSRGAEGALSVKFRLFDVFSEAPLGDGLRLSGNTGNWRRLAHKVADEVYSRITGEDGYFDSRVAFVSESGSKGDRVKRLAVMDYDGANLRFLTGGGALVLAPRYSPTGDRLLFVGYGSGFPEVNILDLTTGGRRQMGEAQGTMTFAPRFAPDGRTVVYSLSRGGNADLYRRRLGGAAQRLTTAPSIETAPGFSPDGSRIVFESDRSGTQQLYVMPAGGGEARRISFGEGRYSTPVWSPRGDRIAFTKQAAGRFHIGVMRPDGSGERLLTSSFLDEGPTWAPNGRVLMFTRETAGRDGAPALYTVGVSGRNLRRVDTPGPASDPSWSPRLP